MDKIISTNSVYVGQSIVQGAGRGVFARQNILKGEMIETCPIIEITPYDMANLNESILLTYFFFYGEDKENSCIALGFGSLYNHSHVPNAVYTVYASKKIIEFVALTNILIDTEITFDYTSGNSRHMPPLWFESGA